MRAWLLALLLALVLSGCSDKDDGGSDDGPDNGGDADDGGVTPGPGTQPIAPMPEEVNITVTAVGTHPIDPAFDPETLTVPAGAIVHVTFDNEDTNPLAPHNWVVEGIQGASSETINPGESTAFDFTAPAEAGEHVYYCSIQGHREAGMEGTLSVAVA